MSNEFKDARNDAGRDAKIMQAPPVTSRIHDAIIEPADDARATLQSVAGISASTFAQTIERTQISRYHTANGFGFAAEDALNLNDRLAGRTVIAAGQNGVRNGADRIVDGIAYQTKYCRNARATVRSLFDPKTALYRYGDMKAEVPPEQYELAVRLMERRIARGQVPGVTDPKDAANLIKAGSITRAQAVKIARAGTIEGLTYDAKLNVLNASFTCTLTFLVSLAQRKWGGASARESFEGAVRDALASGLLCMGTVVGSAQLMRTQGARVLRVGMHDGVKVACRTEVGRKVVHAVAKASLRKAVYGGAAISHVAKLARSNTIANGVTTVAMSVPDLYRATIKKNMSWAQVGKNAVINGAGVAGGSLGWWGGATVGSLVGTSLGPVGTAVGFVTGGLMGAFGVGSGSSWLASKAMDGVVEDDAAEVLERMPEWLTPLVHDYLLTSPELDELLKTVRQHCTPEFLRRLFGGRADAARLVYEEFEPACFAIVRKRGTVTLRAV
ncbi:hypothetical protein [Luteimonas terrae]|uniref:Uncharacterized protein n=1 Tax=Luteimonas terrae TaxID=1530191 RepID=A0A4R5U9F3_9GAMM|nr:hypothetical protein [Luteimonas terrae]TDK30968.1 hypothetical protein E2F49_11570 [Luteimonas terrae]